MKRSLVIQFIIGGMCLCSSGSVHSDERAMVDSFHESLVAMMGLPKPEARLDFIKPEVVRLYDCERIASVSLGRTWRTLDAEQQLEFVALVQHDIARTYATRFNENRGQKFSVLDVQDVKKGFVVRSVIETPKQSVELDYFFMQGKIFNVAANGVSDLPLRRAEYSTILRDHGYDALVSKLETGE